LNEQNISPIDGEEKISNNPDKAPEDITQAIMDNRLDSLQELLKIHTHAPSPIGLEGYTMAHFAISAAVQHNNPTILKTLLTTYGRDQWPNEPEGFTIAHYAILKAVMYNQSGSVILKELLSRYGHEQWASVIQGLTIVHYAIVKAIQFDLHVSLSAVLKEYGDKPGTGGDAKYTLVHFAIMTAVLQGRIESLKAILTTHGDNQWSNERPGYNLVKYAISKAVQYKQLDSLKALLKTYDKESGRNKLVTPLMNFAIEQALQNRQFDMVKGLFTNINSQDGDDPKVEIRRDPITDSFDITISTQKTNTQKINQDSLFELYDTLQQRIEGSFNERASLPAAQKFEELKRHIQMAGRMHSKKRRGRSAYNLDQKNAQGKTLLILLLSDRSQTSEDKMKNAKSPSGMFVTQRDKLINLLIDNHANINLCDNENVSPLMYAVQNADYKIISMLLEKGADIGYENNGKTAISLAKERGNRDIFKLLQSIENDRKRKKTLEEKRKKYNQIKIELDNLNKEIQRLINIKNRREPKAGGFCEKSKNRLTDLQRQAEEKIKTLGTIADEVSRLEEKEFDLQHFELKEISARSVLANNIQFLQEKLNRLKATWNSMESNGRKKNKLEKNTCSTSYQSTLQGEMKAISDKIEIQTNALNALRGKKNSDLDGLTLESLHKKRNDVESKINNLKKQIASISASNLPLTVPMSKRQNKKGKKGRAKKNRHATNQAEIAQKKQKLKEYESTIGKHESFLNEINTAIKTKEQGQIQSREPLVAPIGPLNATTPALIKTKERGQIQSLESMDAPIGPLNVTMPALINSQNYSKALQEDVRVKGSRKDGCGHLSVVRSSRGSSQEEFIKELAESGFDLANGENKDERLKRLGITVEQDSKIPIEEAKKAAHDVAVIIEHNMSRYKIDDQELSGRVKTYYYLLMNYMLGDNTGRLYTGSSHGSSMTTENFPLLKGIIERLDQEKLFHPKGIAKILSKLLFIGNEKNLKLPDLQLSQCILTDIPVLETILESKKVCEKAPLTSTEERDVRDKKEQHEILETIKKEALESIKSGQSYTSFALDTVIASAAGDTKTKVVRVEDASVSSKLSDLMQAFQQSDQKNCLIPIYTFTGLSNDTTKNHFTGLFIKKVDDHESKEFKEGVMYQAVYIDPACCKENLPNEVTKILETVLAITLNDIEYSNTVLQPVVEEGEGDQKTRYLANQHCGAFVGFVLSGLAKGEIIILKGRLHMQNTENAWVPFNDLDNDQSDYLGGALRYLMDCSLLEPVDLKQDALTAMTRHSLFNQLTAKANLKEVLLSFCESLKDCQALEV
jgi:hypothetical protein